MERVRNVHGTRRDVPGLRREHLERVPRVDVAVPRLHARDFDSKRPSVGSTPCDANNNPSVPRVNFLIPSNSSPIRDFTEPNAEFTFPNRDSTRDSLGCSAISKR